MASLLGFFDGFFKKKEEPKPVNYNTINQGLNAGKSWEDISRSSGIDLNTIKSYSQQTRPNYGVSAPRPTLSVQKPQIPSLAITQPAKPQLTIQPSVDQTARMPKVLSPQGQQDWLKNDNDPIKSAMQEIKDGASVRDVNNYYGAENTSLINELSKGKQADRNKIRGLTQSLRNRRQELNTGTYQQSQAFDLQKRLAPQFAQGKSYQDMQKNAGVSMQEIEDYKKAYHPTYGQKGLLQDTARGVWDIGSNMVGGAAGIVTKPFTDLGDLDRKKGEAELQQINQDWRTGKITGNAAMERAQKLASGYTTQKAYYDDKDGYIKVGNQNVAEFAGNITDQGINTASILPMVGGPTTALARKAAAQGASKTANLLTKASDFMTGGAGIVTNTSRLAPQAAKVTNLLTKTGMSKPLADTIGKSVVSNAVQAGVYGTAQTGADIASGRGVSPESLLMNYGADFVMGTGMELGTAGLLRGGQVASESLPTHVQNIYP